VEGQSLLLQCHQAVWLDHFSWLVRHSELGSVQEVHHEIHSSQGLEQSYFLLHKKIGSFPLEDLVRLLVDHDHDIAGLFIGVLVRLSVEHVLLTVRRTLVDGAFENLLLLDDLLSIALSALVGLIDLLSAPAAVTARSRALRVHAWPEHCHPGHLSAPFAS